MASYEHCFRVVKKAANGKLTDQQISSILDDLEKVSRGRTVSAGSILNTSDELIGRLAHVYAQQKLNVVLDGIKRFERRNLYDQASSPEIGIEAALTGVNQPFAKNRLSAAAIADGWRNRVLGGVVTELQDAGVLNLFQSRTLESAWIQELSELNKGPKGKPGVSEVPQARRIAEILHKYQRLTVHEMNKQGAWIGDYFGYVTKTTHDPLRMRKVDPSVWVSEIKPLLDLEKTFPNPDTDVDDALNRVYERLASGVHQTVNEGEIGRLSFVQGQNFAMRVSRERKLHFKDANTWRLYNEKFGRFNASEQIVRGFDYASRDIGLMRNFGTNPKAALEADFKYLEQKHMKDFTKLEKLRKAKTRLNTQMSYLDGTANIPINEMAASITNAAISVERMSKLGLLPLTQMTEFATKLSEIRYQGIPLMKGYARLGREWFKGAESKEVARLVGVGLDGIIGRMTNSFKGEDNPIGVITRAENFFFRLTGATSMTENTRADTALIFGAWLGSQRGVEYKTLVPETQRILKSFGIEDAEWNLLNEGNWSSTGKQTFLAPSDALSIPDERVAAYLQANPPSLQFGKRVVDQKNFKVTPKLIQNFKEELADRLQAYYADRVDHAILKPGAKERAAMLRGFQPGSAPWVAARLVGTFKSFFFAQTYRTFGREINGGQGSTGALAGITQFIAHATLLGLLSNAAKDVAGGRDPFATWENKPIQALVAGITRGGAFGYYGDYLFGQFDRLNRDVLASLAGPTIGKLSTAFGLWGDYLAGKRVGGGATRLALDMIPGQNIWYTKMAYDMMIKHQFLEMIQPGYFREMSRRAKKSTGSRYFVSPGLPEVIGD